MFCLINLNMISFAEFQKEKFIFILEVIQLLLNIIVKFQEYYALIFAGCCYLLLFIYFSRIICFYNDKKNDMKAH